MNSTSPQEQVAKTGNLLAALIMRQYKSIKTAKFMESQSKIKTI